MSNCVNNIFNNVFQLSHFAIILTTKFATRFLQVQDTSENFDALERSFAWKAFIVDPDRN